MLLRVDRGRRRGGRKADPEGIVSLGTKQHCRRTTIEHRADQKRAYVVRVKLGFSFSTKSHAARSARAFEAAVRRK
jgi:hypothetical protein